MDLAHQKQVVKKNPTASGIFSDKSKKTGQSCTTFTLKDGLPGIMKSIHLVNKDKTKNNKQKRILKNYKTRTHFLDFLQKLKNFFRLQFSGLFHHAIIVNGHLQSL